MWQKISSYRVEKALIIQSHEGLSLRNEEVRGGAGRSDAISLSLQCQPSNAFEPSPYMQLLEGSMSLPYPAWSGLLLWTPWQFAWSEYILSPGYMTVPSTEATPQTAPGPIEANCWGFLDWDTCERWWRWMHGVKASFSTLPGDNKDRHDFCDLSLTWHEGTLGSSERASHSVCACSWDTRIRWSFLHN